MSTAIGGAAPWSWFVVAASSRVRVSTPGRPSPPHPHPLPPGGRGSFLVWPLPYIAPAIRVARRFAYALALGPLGGGTLGSRTLGRRISQSHASPPIW